MNLQTHMFYEELSQAVWIPHTFLQLSQEITVWHETEKVRQKQSSSQPHKHTQETNSHRDYDTSWTIIKQGKREREIKIQKKWVSYRRHISDSLLMPIMDLVDVSKHNPVLPFHVLWNSLISHGGHVALHTHTHTHTHTLITTEEVSRWKIKISLSL